MLGGFYRRRLFMLEVYFELSVIVLVNLCFQYVKRKIKVSMQIEEFGNPELSFLQTEYQCQVVNKG